MKTKDRFKKTERRQRETTVQNSWRTALLLWLGLSAAVTRGAEAGVETSLTNARQVIAFDLERSRLEHPPARVRGVVTLSMGSRPPSAFVQDETAGVYVVYTNDTTLLSPGDEVEVDGVVDGGLHQPMINFGRLRPVGQAPFPKPSTLTVDEMKAGAGFAQWAAVNGIVRDMNLSGRVLALSVASGGQRVFCRIVPWPVPELPLHWLESELHLEGVCWTQVDEQNRPYGFHLVVPGQERIAVREPGNTNLFALAEVTPQDASLLRAPSDRRLRITGTVVAHPAGGPVYLTTEFGPLRAEPLVPMPRQPGIVGLERAPETPLRPGQRVSVIGAPRGGRFAPTLWDAEFRAEGEGEASVPLPVKVEELMEGAHDARLVTLRSRCRGQEERPDAAGRRQILVLESGGTVMEAFWTTEEGGRLPAVPLNGRVEVTGLVEMQPGFGPDNSMAKLRLRSPADARFLGPSRWWEELPTGRILLGALAVLAAALIWAGLLRRQVTLRTSELADEVEERKRAQADLARALGTERELNEIKSRFVSMVSHEFRTPLGIIMSAVELLRNYLDRLDTDKRRELLEDIHGSTRQMAALMEQVLVLGRVEAGKVGYRPEAVDLPTLCGKVADESFSATNGRCSVDLRLDPALDGATGDESLLRHILSNLISNAIKYSNAGEPVALEVRREGTESILAVSDRGIGIPEVDRKQLFEAFHRGSNVGEIPGTGLGLLIVKRCVELHGGSIDVKSEVGRGTTFTVRLPLFG